MRLAMVTVALLYYQFCLSHRGLTTYVFDAPRDPSSFFSMNREGILGVVGYLTLHIMAEAVGAVVLWPVVSPGGRCKLKNAHMQTRYSLIKVVIVDAVVWALLGGSVAAFHQPISRRLVNLPYVLWVAALNLFLLALIMATDIWASLPPDSSLMASINRSQLAFFLVANLFTGVVNLSMYTLYTPPTTAFVVVVLYVLIVTSLFFVLDRVFDKTLKFW